MGGDGGFGAAGNRSLMSPTRPNVGLGAKTGVVRLSVSVSSSDDRSMLNRCPRTDISLKKKQVGDFERSLAGMSIKSLLATKSIKRDCNQLNREERIESTSSPQNSTIQ